MVKEKEIVSKEQSSTYNIYLPLSVVFATVLLAASVFLVGSSVTTALNQQTNAIVEFSAIEQSNASALTAVLSQIKTIDSESSSTNLANNTLAQITEEVIPKGVPEIYGPELDVSFDEVEESLSILAKLDKSIEFAALSAEEQEKYLNASTNISCEYCCGAKYVTTPSGDSACGCSHSAAMRGLGKYLVKNHFSEYSDEAVLEELANWKAVFFPKQTIQAAVQLKAQSGEIDASLLSQLPNMVGGC